MPRSPQSHHKFHAPVSAIHPEACSFFESCRYSAQTCRRSAQESKSASPSRPCLCILPSFPASNPQNAPAPSVFSPQNLFFHLYRSLFRPPVTFFAICLISREIFPVRSAQVCRRPSSLTKIILTAQRILQQPYALKLSNTYASSPLSPLIAPRSAASIVSASSLTISAA